MLRVSVIIPTFNRANYLPEALRSVLAQTLPPDEIIVVDDGSTDDTAQIGRAFGERVRYYWQENQGVAAARNRGLELARGDVIAWLDADDMWEPDFLATLVPLLSDDQKLDGVYCGLTHIDAESQVLHTPPPRVVPPAGLFSALIEADFVVTPAIVVRKRCYDQVGAFDPQFRICEDYDMWLRLAKAFTIAGIPKPLVRVRVHGDSTIMRETTTLCQSRLALTRKHFGEYQGDPAGWPEDKRRAYAYAFLTCSLRYIQDGELEVGWRYLGDAARVWPELLNRLDVFYELAFGAQARGQRGRVDLLDIEGNTAELLRRLETLFADPALLPMRSRAYANAYLALGILNDQAGRWSSAKSYLLRAVAENPRLLGSYSVLRRMVKLYSGQRLARLARSLQGQVGAVQKANL